MQVEIRVAWKNNDKAKVATLQHNLVKSWVGRAMAVRIVVTNKGKNTPGIDGVVWNTPDEKFTAISELKVGKGYKCKPVRRVYIPKANGGLRPLGIPTMFDRRFQALWKQALDPIAESQRDTHSYGFRKGRSTKDARTMTHLLIGSAWRPSWVMDADIKGFFDNISHDWLLKNIPMDEHILREWLKAGAIDMVKDESLESVSGVPQGGPISPTIANMALDGLQQHIQQTVEHLRFKGKIKGRTVEWSPKVNVIRYRDDFIVTAATRRILENKVKPAVKDFLAERGLELNETKTLIVSVKEGFNFLGYNFRTYLYPRRPTGYIGITKPSQKGLERLYAKIRQVVKTSQSAGQQVYRLNAIIRGWANYYSNVTAKRIFTKVGYYLWIKLWKWAVKKHKGAPAKEIRGMYWKTVGSRNWVFFGKYEDKVLLLYDIRNTPIRRHLQIQKDKNPYDPEHSDYFLKRRSKGAKLQLWGTRQAKLVRKTNHKCLVCEQPLLFEQDLEVHHVLPKRQGGSDKPRNLIVLHKECHKLVTYTTSKTLLAQFKEKGVLHTRST